MELYGLKDIKTGGFSAVLGVGSKHEYIESVKAGLRDPEGALALGAQDKEIYKMGDIAGNGKVSGDPEYIGSLLSVRRDVERELMSWLEMQVENVKTRLGESDVNAE